jgi:DNA-binding phage protein
MTIDLSEQATYIVRIFLITDFDRKSFYKALRACAIPRFDTVLKVLQALGVQMLAQPITPLP